MSFQSNAFQSSAFQMHYYNFPQGTGWDRPKKLWHWPERKKLIEERIESLPDVVVEAVADVVEIDERAKREAEFDARLDGIDRKFKRMYFALMEQYYSILLDEQIALELAAAKKREDDELALILLLSS